MNTTSIGRRAERMVAAHLQSIGYTIKQLNWQTPYAEVDIIARKDECFYFVEVKYRATTSHGDGFEYISAQKLNHMRRATALWVKTTGWTGSIALLFAATDATGHIELAEL